MYYKSLFMNQLIDTKEFSINEGISNALYFFRNDKFTFKFLKLLKKQAEIKNVEIALDPFELYRNMKIITIHYSIKEFPELTQTFIKNII